MDARHKAGIAAAVGVVAIGVIAAVSGGDGAPAEAPRAPGLVIRHTDLASAPVQPGDETTTGVRLPAGARVLAVDPSSPFVIVSKGATETIESVWFEVTAKNAGPAPMRFTAIISFEAEQ